VLSKASLLGILTACALSTGALAADMGAPVPVAPAPAARLLDPTPLGYEVRLGGFAHAVGSLIDEGTLLTTLSNNKEVYAYFNVSEKEYLDFKTRAKNDDRNIVTLLLANGQPHKYKGVIETVEGEFDRNTGSIPFRAKFPNPDYLLKHGETGKVQLTVDVKDALIIPQKATYELQDKVYVFVVDEHNIVKARNITIAQELPNLYVVSKGLSAGDKILLEGVQSVKEDDSIQPVYTPVRQVIEHLQLIK